MQLALRLAHLIAASVWFAATLTTAGDVRRSVQRGGSHADAMIDRVKLSIMVSLIAGLLTVVTGLLMTLALGGLRAVPPRIHVAFAVTLGAQVIEARFLGPTFHRIAEAIHAARMDEALAAAKRFSALTGALHLLRTVVFALMVFRAS